VIPALVIGFGNTLRGDDGAGILAAEQLAARLPDLAVDTMQGLQPELAERLRGFGRVVFLDASLRNPHLAFSLLDGSPRRTRPGSHSLSPAEIMDLCFSLYKWRPEEAMLVEIPAYDCGIGTAITEATRSAITACVEAVARILCNDQAFSATLSSNPVEPAA
jgi:hydrogenase maturation protease